VILQRYMGVVGYPYSQAWHDRRGVYRAAAHTDRPAHVASPQGVKFAPDSPLEGAVTSEPVSEAPKFPASRENTGNFIDLCSAVGANGSKKWRETRGLPINSLRIGAGNFLRPCRELNRAIRESFALIREIAMAGSGKRWIAPTNAEYRQGARSTELNHSRSRATWWWEAFRSPTGPSRS
jgi:hypothetical protein